MENFLASTLRQLANDTVSVFDYNKDLIDFTALWGLSVFEGSTQNLLMPMAADCQLTLDEISRKRKILLIDAPGLSVIPDDVFGKHVGPLQWSVVFLNALKEKRSHLPIPEIGILNISSYLRTTDDIPYGINHFCCNPQDLERLVDWILRLTEEIKPCEDMSEYLDTWRIGLAVSNSRKTHHYLNNLLGPIALAAGIKDDSTRRNVLAWHKDKRQNLAAAALMRALEWGTNDLDANYADKIIALNKIDSRNKELRILILDDQIYDGWIPIFSHVLGLCQIDHDMCSAELQFTCCGERRVNHRRVLSLWIATSPDAVLGQLYNGPKIGTLYFTESTTRETFDEMLFLDLRLYSNDQDKERAFFERLDPQNCKPPSNLPKNNTESNAYLEKLTSLAKLISIIDFTYPMAIWSSTGQRRVVEAFKDYHNIYSGLEKPRFDAYSNGITIINLVDDLNKLFEFSLKYLAARDSLQKINLLTQGAPKIDFPGASNDLLRLEIFLDETGTGAKGDPMWVGGVALLFSGSNSGKKIRDVSKDLSVTMAKTEWANVGGIPRKLDWTTGAGENRTKKDHRKRYSKEIWTAFCNCAASRSVSVFPFALRTPEFDSILTSDSFRFLDARYYLTAPSLIQAVINLTAKPSQRKQGQIAVVAGNRVKRTGLTPDEWRMHFRTSWGRSTYLDTNHMLDEKGFCKYFSIGDQWVHATTTQAYIQALLPNGWRIDAATAVHLGDDKSIPQNDSVYRMAQFLPDLILSQINSPSGVISLYTDILDAAFNEALKASKNAMVENASVVDVLISSYRAQKFLDQRAVDDKVHFHLVQSLVNTALNKVNTKLTSIHFAEFAQAIGQQETE
jgi:hypothetical protein